MTIVSLSDAERAFGAVSKYQLFPDDLNREACGCVSRNLREKQEWRKYLDEKFPLGGHVRIYQRPTERTGG